MQRSNKTICCINTSNVTKGQKYLNGQAISAIESRMAKTINYRDLFDFYTTESAKRVISKFYLIQIKIYRRKCIINLIYNYKYNAKNKVGFAFYFFNQTMTKPILDVFCLFLQ